MTHIEIAIRDAVEKGGYKDPRFSITTKEDADEKYAELLNEYAKWTQRPQVFLDPAFWQALGKARGWNEGGYGVTWTFNGDLIGQRDGINKSEHIWHQFINHLQGGKDAESFFADLK